MSKLNKGFYELYCEEVAKNKVLKNEIAQLKRTILSLTQELDYPWKNHDKIIEAKVNAAVKKATHIFEDKVATLEKLVQHLKSVLNNDSSNSGIPTAMTSINKAKRIPNSRENQISLKVGKSDIQSIHLNSFMKKKLLTLLTIVSIHVHYAILRWMKLHTVNLKMNGILK